MNRVSLLFEATSFYNAFINLEKINDVLGKVKLIPPVIVNGAFSIELSLKAILTIADIDYKKEHSIKRLFNMLPKDIQEQIWSWIAEKTPEYANVHICNDELSMISDAFIKWRYLFEGDPAPAIDMRFLSIFANATFGVMASLNPEIELVETSTELSADEIEKQFVDNRKLFIKSQ
jgi:hypothetical protein